MFVITVEMMCINNILLYQFSRFNALTLLSNTRTSCIGTNIICVFSLTFQWLVIFTRFSSSFIFFPPKLLFFYFRLVYMTKIKQFYELRWKFISFTLLSNYKRVKKYGQNTECYSYSKKINIVHRQFVCYERFFFNLAFKRVVQTL